MHKGYTHTSEAGYPNAEDCTLHFSGHYKAFLKKPAPVGYSLKKQVDLLHGHFTINNALPFFTCISARAEK